MEGDVGERSADAVRNLRAHATHRRWTIGNCPPRRHPLRQQVGEIAGQVSAPCVSLFVRARGYKRLNGVGVVAWRSRPCRPDHEAHVQAARACGWHAVWHRDTDVSIQEITMTIEQAERAAGS